MKKAGSVLFFSLFMAFYAVSQITITNSSVPVPGLLPRFSLADSASIQNLNYNQSGANQIWDFTMLNPQFQRVDTFVAVPLNYQVSFTGATVARKVPIGDGNFAPPGGGSISISNAYQMYKKSTSKYENMGFGGTVSGTFFPLAFANNPMDVVYRFPLNYDDKDTSFSQAILDVPGFIYMKQTQLRINHVDGWGQVITPYKTFDALRVKSKITGRDSIVYNGFDFVQNRLPQTEYKWLATSEKVPVLTINTRLSMGATEMVNNVIYRDTLQDVPYFSVTPTRPMLEASLYPNPASETAQIGWDEPLGQNAKMEVFDMSGALVYTQPVEGLSSLSFSLSHFPVGAYQIKLSGEKKQFIGTLLVK